MNARTHIFRHIPALCLAGKGVRLPALLLSGLLLTRP